MSVVLIGHCNSQEHKLEIWFDFLLVSSKKLQRRHRFSCDYCWILFKILVGSFIWEGIVNFRDLSFLWCDTWGVCAKISTYVSQTGSWLIFRWAFRRKFQLSQLKSSFQRPKSVQGLRPPRQLQFFHNSQQQLQLFHWSSLCFCWYLVKTLSCNSKIPLKRYKPFSENNFMYSYAK